MRFCQGANLRGMIADRALPEVLQPFYPKLDSMVAGRYRGSLEYDIAALDPNSWLAVASTAPTTLSTVELRLLSTLEIPLDVVDLESIFHRGRAYATGQMDNTTERSRILDSNISFSINGVEVGLGRIQRIVATKDALQQRSARGLWLFVRRFRPLSAQESLKNPYSYWPDLHCTMVENEFEDEVHLIPYSAIVGQLAVCPFKDPEHHFSVPCIAALTLE